RLGQCQDAVVQADVALDGIDLQVGQLQPFETSSTAEPVGVEVGGCIDRDGRPKGGIAAAGQGKRRLQVEMFRQAREVDVLHRQGRLQPCRSFAADQPQVNGAIGAAVIAETGLVK